MSRKLAACATVTMVAALMASVHCACSPPEALDKPAYVQAMIKESFIIYGRVDKVKDDKFHVLCAVRSQGREFPPSINILPFTDDTVCLTPDTAYVLLLSQRKEDNAETYRLLREPPYALNATLSLPIAAKVCRLGPHSLSVPEGGSKDHCPERTVDKSTCLDGTEPTGGRGTAIGGSLLLVSMALYCVYVELRWRYQ